MLDTQRYFNVSFMIKIDFNRQYLCSVIFVNSKTQLQVHVSGKNGTIYNLQM